MMSTKNSNSFFSLIITIPLALAIPVALWASQCVHLRCVLNANCMTLPDGDCYGCDPIGSGRCSDSFFIDYNPQNIVINDVVYDPTLRIVTTSEAICSNFQSCDQGATILLETCVGNGNGCSDSIPSFCQVCERVGNVVPSIVNNFHCHSCPEPPGDP